MDFEAGTLVGYLVVGLLGLVLLAVVFDTWSQARKNGEALARLEERLRKQG